MALGLKNEVKTNEQGNGQARWIALNHLCALEVKASDTQTLHGYATKSG